MADRNPRTARNKAAGHGAASALALVTLAVVAAVAGVVLWLALSAEDTMERLRADADRRSLYAELVLPPADAAAEPAATEPGPESGMTDEPVAGPVAEDVPETGEAVEPRPAVEAETPEPVEIPADPPAADPAPPEPPLAADASPVPPPAAPPMPAEEPDVVTEEAAPGSPPVETASPPGESEDETQVAALPAAPDPALVESAAVGPLPRIGPDGREPWRAYARPFDETDDRPRIAIVITDLGQSGAATETAIQGLPGPVTLAFAPYAPRLRTWLPEARAAGHETLLMVPMEPASYPRNDPGPHTLLTSLSPASNQERLNWVLSRANGYVGVVNSMGSRLTTAPEALRPVLEALDSRGLMFLDSRTAATSVAARVAEEIGLPHAANDRFIDDVASRDAIDLRLRELEALAREQGYAVGMAYPYPVSFERLAAWIPTLEEKGFVLAPISAIAAAPQDHSG